MNDERAGLVARAAAWSGPSVLAVATAMGVAGTLAGFARVRGAMVLGAAVLAAAALLRFRRPLGAAAEASGARFGLLPVLVAAVAVRAAWAVLVPSRPVSDFAGYLEFARNIAERGFFGPDAGPFAFRPAGFSFGVAALSKTGPGYETAAVLLNVTAGALTVLPVAGWGTLLAGRRAGFAAAWLFALLPESVVFSSIAGTEPLFTLGFAALGYGFARIAADPPAGFARRAGLALLLGFGVAAASMVRAHALPLPIAAALPAAATGGRFRPRRLAIPLAAFVLGVVLLVPWGLRNQRTLGRFSLLTTNGGTTLYIANNPQADGTFPDPADRPPELPGDDEFARNSEGYRRAVEWIAANPGDFLALVPRKWFHLFEGPFDVTAWAMNERPGGALATGVRAGNQIGWLVLLALSLAGAARAARTPDRRALAAAGVAGALLLYWLALHAVYHGQPRFAFPLLPLFATLAAPLFCSHRPVRPLTPKR